MKPFLCIILIPLVFSVSYSDEEAEYKQSEEDILIIILNAFKPLHIDLDQSVKMVGMSISLSSEELLYDCVPKAYNVNTEDFIGCYYSVHSAAYLIQHDIPLEKVISSLHIYRKRRDLVRKMLHSIKNYPMRISEDPFDKMIFEQESFRRSTGAKTGNIPEKSLTALASLIREPGTLLMPALYSVGYNIKLSNLNTMLSQSRVLFSSGYDGQIPFKVSDIDLNKIPDHFIEDDLKKVREYLGRHKDKELPFTSSQFYESSI